MGKVNEHYRQQQETAQAEILEIDYKTGEIILSADAKDTELIKTTKVKAFNLLARTDFVQINGVWEAKRDALIKILSSLPLSYSWHIKEAEMTTAYSKILGVLTITTGSLSRQAESFGICELSELKGNGGMHFMNARAETRALKRAIETLFGSVINYFVVTYMDKAA